MIAAQVRVTKSKKVPPLKLHYKGHDFFRVVPGFLCQGGDITRHPQNLGGRSIYGNEPFDDEGFKIKHKGAGDLLMANAGHANNNHSQFAIAMSHLTEFETKHVIFGKVAARPRAHPTQRALDTARGPTAHVPRKSLPPSRHAPTGTGRG